MENNLLETPAMTVVDLDKIIEDMVELEKKIEAKEKEVTELNKEMNRLKFRAADYLNEIGRPEYSSPKGKIEFKIEWRVKMPQTDQDKINLFNHLKEREIFEKYATVNSNSLNSLYKADWEAAKARGEGMEFRMPGIEAPIPDRVPKFKAAKEKKNVTGE